MFGRPRPDLLINCATYFSKSWIWKGFAMKVSTLHCELTVAVSKWADIIRFFLFYSYVFYFPFL